MARKPPPPAGSSPVAAIAHEADLKATIRRLSQQLDRARATKDDLVDAVYRAARDGIAGLTLPPVTPPKPVKADAGTEVAVAVLSDWQLAKRTASYSSEICEARIGRYADKVRRFTDRHRAHNPVKECRVWLLGDLVEGELIFAGQAHKIDASLYRQVTLDGPRILGDFLRRMLGHFDRVHVTAVIGNHGEIGGPHRREMHPESNADRALYRITQQLLASETRLTWTIPEDPHGHEDGWYAVDRIGTYGTLLIHGHQLRGPTGAAWGRTVQGWANGGLPGREAFRDAIAGHWHRLWEIPFSDQGLLRVNGSVESANGYASQWYSSMARPAQRLMFVKPDQGPTAEWKVWLT